MGTLFLIRGLPGSGKSTLARQLTTYNIATDDFTGLYDKNGFLKKELLPIAHQWCFDTVLFWMTSRRETIAVHNTFVLNEWIYPYERLARKYKYRFNVIECKGDFGSIHNVPPEVITRFKNMWEEYKPETRKETL